MGRTSSFFQMPPHFRSRNTCACTRTPAQTDFCTVTTLRSPGACISLNSPLLPLQEASNCLGSSGVADWALAPRSGWCFGSEEAQAHGCFRSYSLLPPPLPRPFGELQPRPSSAPWFSPPGFQQRGNSCCSLTALHSHQAKLEQASRCHLLPLDSSNRTSRQLISKSHVSAAGLVLTRRHAARTNSKK